MYMDYRTILKKWLTWKAACDGEKVTQKWLAEEAGVHETTISGIMNARHVPEFDTINKIAGAFNVTVSQFLDGPQALQSPMPETLPKNETREQLQMEILKMTEQMEDDKLRLLRDWVRACIESTAGAKKNIAKEL